MELTRHTGGLGVQGGFGIIQAHGGGGCGANEAHGAGRFGTNEARGFRQTPHQSPMAP